MVKAVSGIRTHSLVCFPVMLPKPLINESLALVTHAEGQSHESVYFQMHENTPLRAEKSKRRERPPADGENKKDDVHDVPFISALLFPELTLAHLRRGDLHVDDDGGEGGLPQLGGVIDGVRVQDHQLQRPGQLENPLNLTLDLS